MKRPRELDLAILGGGCAGLALGRELARAEQAGSAVPRTCIFEAREGYTRDRTWCSFAPAGRPDPLVHREWDQWCFSARKRTVIHAPAHWRYRLVRSDDFYADAWETVAPSSRVQLATGAPVEAVARDGSGWRVRSGGRWYGARQVVDARPPEAERVEASLLHQVFLGVEIELETGGWSGRPVGLMEHLRAGQAAVCFDYVLPLEDRRLLVEATRFARPGWSWAQLEEDLWRALARAAGSCSFRVVRRERGVIPMGLPRLRFPPPRGWITAGTAGGAVRPATGYAYARIQSWARRCSHSLLAGRGLVGPASDGIVLRAMDACFLRALACDPGRGAGWFMAMAERVAPDRLTRFLAGVPTLRDHGAIIRSLPSGPFLRSLRETLAARGHRSVRPMEGWT